MNRATALATAGIVGLAIAATGCSDKTEAGHHTTASAPPTAASSSPAETHYDNAQAIADKIKAAGLTVGELTKNADESYISDVGGKSYDLQISQKPGQKIGNSGINLFPNPQALTAWTGVSQAMGGIAVVGDTWAVSLSSESPDRAISSAMAVTIAKALGGTVAK